MTEGEEQQPVAEAPGAWAAGWYPDPWMPEMSRYWNGHEWTADTAAGQPAPTVAAAATWATTAAPTWGATAAPTWGTTAAPTGGVSAPSEPWTSPWTSPTPPVWQAPDAGEPGHRGHVPWIAILGCVILAVLVTAGVLVATGTISNSSHSSTLTSPPSIPVAPGPGVGPLADQIVLQRLGVRQSDVGASSIVQTIANGDQAQGVATLDLCNGTFPSESRRVARHQAVAGTTTSTTTGFSTEAVIYDNAAGTAQSFSELRSVAAACPAKPVTSPVGEPTVQTSFHATPDKAWPQTAKVERLAFDFDSNDAQGTTRSIAVYLRHGRVLLAIYFPHPDGAQLAVGGKTSIPDIVALFESRLAHVSDSIANGHESPTPVPGAV